MIFVTSFNSYKTKNAELARITAGQDRTWRWMKLDQSITRPKMSPFDIICYSITQFYLNMGPGPVCNSKLMSKGLKDRFSRQLWSMLGSTLSCCPATRLTQSSWLWSLQVQATGSWPPTALLPTPCWSMRGEFVKYKIYSVPTFFVIKGWGYMHGLRQVLEIENVTLRDLWSIKWAKLCKFARILC